MADLFRSNSTTTTRIDAEDNGLHVIVVGQFAKVFSRALADNVMAAARHVVKSLVVNDGTIGIIDGNLLSLLVFVSLYVEHVGERQLRNLVILVKFQTVLDFCFDFLWEHHLVDELGLDIVLGIGKHDDAVVGQLVEVLGLYFATLCHLLEPVVPYPVQVGGALFAVVFAHACLGVALHITLILSDLGSLVLDAQFVVESFHIFTLAAESRKIDHALTIEVDLVGNGSHVVAALHILIGVGYDPLATFLEVLQRITQLLGCSWRVEAGDTAFQVDSLNIVIILGLADTADEIVETHGTHVTHVKQGVEGRTCFCALVDDTIELKYKDRVFLYFG